MFVPSAQAQRQRLPSPAAQPMMTQRGGPSMGPLELEEEARRRELMGAPPTLSAQAQRQRQPTPEEMGMMAAGQPGMLPSAASAQPYPTLPPGPGQGTYSTPPVASPGTWAQLPSMALTMPTGFAGSPWQLQQSPTGAAPSWENSPAGQGPQINPNEYLRAGTQPVQAPQQPQQAAPPGGGAYWQSGAGPMAATPRAAQRAHQQQYGRTGVATPRAMLSPAQQPNETSRDWGKRRFAANFGMLPGGVQMRIPGVNM